MKRKNYWQIFDFKTSKWAIAFSEGQNRIRIHNWILTLNKIFKAEILVFRAQTETEILLVRQFCWNPLQRRLKKVKFLFSYWILDPKSCILDQGFRIQDKGSGIRDSGPWIMDFGSWIPDSRSGISNDWRKKRIEQNWRKNFEFFKIATSKKKTKFEVKK